VWGGCRAFARPEDAHPKRSTVEERVF